MLFPLAEFVLKYLCKIGLFFILISVTLPSCTHAEPPVGAINNDQLINLLQSKNDTLYVINFWKTSCKPCIHEMPYFDKINQKYNGQNIKILLLSLDQDEKALDKVETFRKRFNIKSKILLVNAPQYSLWIDKVDKNYWGTTPATLIYNPRKKQRIFINKELSEGELERLISGYLEE